MKCIVTAGPTFEPLDKVRRLTNFSTGKLGSELANYLTDHGHEVTLLLGESATWCGAQKAKKFQRFSTTMDLRQKLELLAAPEYDAVFHAAAVSDFSFGKVFRRGETGELVEVKSAKIPTRDGGLFAELVPTMKVIGHLRRLFPKAYLVGWKYEMEGNQLSVQDAAWEQIKNCDTDACVVNGRAWGPGFGIAYHKKNGTETQRTMVMTIPDAPKLYLILHDLMRGTGEW